MQIMICYRSCIGIWKSWLAKSRTSTKADQVGFHLFQLCFFPAPVATGALGYSEWITTSRSLWTLLKDGRSEQRQTMFMTNSFQVCTAASVELCNHLVGWKDISASSSDSQSMYFDLTAECSTSGCSGLAYLWRETPCLVHLSCPIYSAAAPNLPATPWIWSLWKNNVVEENKNKKLALILIHSWVFS